MTPPPRRPFFQIHLSTAIVMMFVAGALMWANFTVSTGLIPWRFYKADIVYQDYGWPLTAYHRMFELFGVEELREIVHMSYFSRTAIVLDMVFAFGILFTTYFLCEYLIRRRAARKGA